EDIGGPIDYRGGKEVETAGHKGATRLGVENMAKSCMQGRAVMIDLEAHYGRERKMVGYEDLMGILKKDNVTVEQGDFVCVCAPGSKMCCSSRTASRTPRSITSARYLMAATHGCNNG